MWFLSKWSAQLTLIYSEDMSPTDTLDLDSEDKEFLKTLRRTFKSMAMETRSRVEDEIEFASSQNKPVTMYLIA